ncbi:DotU/TssL family secretion system protein, partial [Brevundimonas sp.]|uniref:DotU/TssL family secretion system protein n=2 Tax=Pseudomonadota TaxID=1224 RepID=UPI002FC709BA
ASPLFGLVIRLRTLDDLPNLAYVHKTVQNQVSNIREEIQQHGYPIVHQEVYSYALCLYLDEAVMSRPWGNNSCWSHQPLLSIFHDETQGGEKIFVLLERVMQDMQRSGPSALRRHVPALQAALDRMPADYTIVANIGDAIVVRSADMKVFLPLQLSLLATDEGRKASGIHAIENTYGMIAQILAFEAVERQDYPTAIAYADRLLAIQPNHPQVQAERIVAYAKMGQCETGLKLAGEALASEDLVLAINRDLFLRRQGYCQIELGRFDDAKASYQAALELNPDDQLSHNQLTYIAQQTRSR